MRRRWQTPRLEVLVRGNPEEAILQSCKAPGSVGPVNVNSNCTLVATGFYCAGSVKS